MSVRFLLFSGSLANEGNFYLLETEKSIIILAAGQGYLPTGLPEQQIGREYLQENRLKVKAIIINNTNFQNIGLLVDICRDLGTTVPLYASFHSKLILTHYLPQLKNRLIVPEKIKEIKVGDFICSFLPLNSYLLGNSAIVIHHFQYSFYFLEAFLFSNLLDSNLLFPLHFLTDLQKFLGQKRPNTYLITNCQGLHWQNNNSLFFALQNFSETDKQLFFLLYDFDWLHILELLEIMRKREKKVRIINKDFSSLLSQILIKDHCREVIKNSDKKEPGEVYLLVSNPKNISQKLSECLANFSPAERVNFHFVVGTPPVIGGEAKLAQLIDYLYTQSETITNLSKKEYLSLGLSFYDFKLLIRLLSPTGIITVQNSYKNKNFFNHLPGKFLTLNNGYAWDFPVHKITQLKRKKTLISLEELLIKQRESLGQSGLLIILLIVEWKENQLQLKKLQIENLAVSSMLDITKLENKIKSWWETKLISDIKKSDPSKLIKKAIEKRLSGLVSSYLSLKCNLELGELLILLFNH